MIITTIRPTQRLALRFLGAVHRLVLQEKAPQLAVCYPSTGGDSNCDDLWPRFRGLVQHHEAVLRELVHRPVQTNEVGRCAALLGGFLEVARQTGLPLRLLEVGAARVRVLFMRQASANGFLIVVKHGLNEG